MSNLQLSKVLSSGRALLESSGDAVQPDLRAVLANRLSAYYKQNESRQALQGSETLEAIEAHTAREALVVIEALQHLLGAEDTSEIPSIGTRDLSHVRTLLSLVFKWGIDPPSQRLAIAWPRKPVTLDSQASVIDLTSIPEDYALLREHVLKLLSVLFSENRLLSTLITTTLLNRHLSDMLRPAITVGWLPSSLASESVRPDSKVRSLVMRLLLLLPPPETITALGTVLASKPPPPWHVKRTASSLLSRELLRPEGVRGLCAAVFGEEQSTSEDAPLEKLEHIARVLSTPPSNSKHEEYFGTIVPRTLALLADSSPSTYNRAAAFATSKMLINDGSYPHYAVVLPVIHSELHLPFLEASENQDQPAETTESGASRALSVLVTLISNTDPSPTLISSILSPIIPALYSLLHHLENTRTADPAITESIRGLLLTWGKVTDTSEGIRVLWGILNSDEIGWKVTLDGKIYRLKKQEKDSSLSLLLPEDVRRMEETEELDLESDMFNLYPKPGHFVRFLKAVDRAEISSDLFVKLLEKYRSDKMRAEVNPVDTLRYLQTIMQMQEQLAGDKPSSNILCKPADMLAFIKHVLQSASPSSSEPRDSQQDPRSPVDLLRFIPAENLDVEEEEDQGDSDDESPSKMPTDDEMTGTAINLLLSILEANEGLSARTAPILTEIFDLLEAVAREGSEIVRPLAREARMVMTARLASSSATTTRRSSTRPDHEDAQETYQKALKLLQDPILPVRAHGLLLLRQLVTPSRNENAQESKISDPALTPAILSIFLQSIHDDDSYIFLNAVQGLSAMVDTFGKDILKGLVREYSAGLTGLGTTNLTQHDVDVRVRVGEALGVVIRRCGSALGNYVDLVVPTLTALVRNSNIPTTLRTSALSLLSECESTHSLAMTAYVDELLEGMIDLLQVEAAGNLASDEAGEDNASMDSQPTSTNSKFPPLRRAALLFISRVIQETTKAVYDSGDGGVMIAPAVMKRAKITLGYIASTDHDNVVRVMAREGVEGLDQLQRAMLGD